MPHWRRKMGSWSAQSLFLVGKRYGEVRKFPFVGSRVHAELWRLSESFSAQREGYTVAGTIQKPGGIALSKA
jgi:hypothetical protein